MRSKRLAIVSTIIAMTCGNTLSSAGELSFTDEIHHRSSKDIPMGDSPTRSMALGISTLSYVTGTTGSLVGQFELGHQNALLVHLGLDSTSPVDFGMGVLLRHDFMDGPVGLHAGGGVGFGAVAGSTATNSVFFNVVGLGGVHFRMPGAVPIEVLLDGGAIFSAASSGINLKIGALSSQLGISVLYHL